MGVLSKTPCDGRCGRRSARMTVIESQRHSLACRGRRSTWLLRTSPANFLKWSRHAPLSSLLGALGALSSRRQLWACMPLSRPRTQSTFSDGAWPSASTHCWWGGLKPCSRGFWRRSLRKGYISAF